MPKFLHTADLHINALRRFSSGQDMPYLRRMERTLDAILDAGEDHDVDFIIVAGDVWDRRDILHPERELLTAWLGKSEKPIIMISGNHDARSSLVGDTSLSYLSGLQAQISDHLIHDGLPMVYRYLSCQFLLLPWGGWSDQEMFLLLHSMLKAVNDDEPVIVVLHENVAGSMTDSGVSLEHHNQVHLPDLPEVTYWALGDIHKCQAILPNAWYPGSPHQVSFGEDVGKGVLIVDTADPTAPKWVPLPAQPLLELNELPEEWPDALVRLNTPSATPLPPQVELGDTATPALPQHSRRLHSLFDGLDEVLLRLGLPEEDLCRAWRLVQEEAEQKGYNIKVPKRYRREMNR